jgi:hypothetical protein
MASPHGMGQYLFISTFNFTKATNNKNFKGFPLERNQISLYYGIGLVFSFFFIVDIPNYDSVTIQDTVFDRVFFLDNLNHQNRCVSNTSEGSDSGVVVFSE